MKKVIIELTPLQAQHAEEKLAYVQALLKEMGGQPSPVFESMLAQIKRQLTTNLTQ